MANINLKPGTLVIVKKHYNQLYKTELEDPAKSLTGMVLERDELCGILEEIAMTAAKSLKIRGNIKYDVLDEVTFVKVLCAGKIDRLPKTWLHISEKDSCDEV